MFKHFTKPDYLNSSDFCIEVLLRSIKTTHIILRTVALFELVMIIYGLSVFNMTRPKAIMYIVSYVVLGLFSILGDVILTLATKDESNRREKFKKCIGFAYLYSIVITIWGMFITYQDVMGSGGYWVLATILFVFPTFVPVNPTFSCGLIIIGSGYMGALMCIKNDGFSTGIANVIILAILACLMVVRHYATLYNNYYMESKLREQSLRDGLTSMFNRRALSNRLESEEIADIQSVAILDLDDFKRLNDDFGHLVGDDSLLLISTYLREFFKDTELYRYGGDEFLILANDGPELVVSKIDEINKRLKQAQERFNLRISVGVAEIREGMSIQEAIDLADKRMYETKKVEKAKNDEE